MSNFSDKNGNRWSFIIYPEKFPVMLGQGIYAFEETYN